MSSLSFRISIGDEKQYALFVVPSCGSTTKFDIVAKPLSHGCGTLFRVIGLPVFLTNNRGFFLCVKYFIQAPVNDSLDYFCLQLNSDNSYSTSATPNENSFGVVFYE